MLRCLSRSVGIGCLGRRVARMFGVGASDTNNSKFERKASSHSYKNSSSKSQQLSEITRLAREEQAKRETVMSQLEARVELFREKVAGTYQTWDLFLPEILSFMVVGKCYFQAAAGVLMYEDLTMLGVPLLVQCGRLLAILISENDLNPTTETSVAPKLKNHKGSINVHHKTEFLALGGTILSVGVLPWISPSIALVLYTYAGVGIFNAVLLDNAGERNHSIPGRRVKYFAIFFMYMVLMGLADLRRRGFMKPKEQSPIDKPKLERVQQSAPAK